MEIFRADFLRRGSRKLKDKRAPRSFFCPTLFLAGYLTTFTTDAGSKVCIWFF